MQRRIFTITIILLTGVLLGGFLIAGLRGGTGSKTSRQENACKNISLARYPVETQDFYAGQTAEIQIADDEQKEVKTILQEGSRKQSDFAGHYAIVGWGCGATCQKHAVIDARDGKIVRFGLESTHGVDYNLNSRLLTVNPRYASIAGEKEPERTDYYEWNEAEKQLKPACE